jgi:hypothetical protein
MMKKSGIALLAFAGGMSVSIFTLPLWVVFAINIAREGTRTDWLGFTGAIIGAAMTVAAAGIAWAAVQRQISIQREIANSQAAIERFNIVQAQLAIVENESRVTRLVALEAQYSTVLQKTYLAGPSLADWQVQAAEKEVEERMASLKSIEGELRLSGTQRWAFNGGPARNDIFLAIYNLRIKSIESNVTFRHALIYNDKATGLRGEDVQACLDVDFSKQSMALEAATDTHLASLTKEIARLSGLLRSLRIEGGL